MEKVLFFCKDLRTTLLLKELKKGKKAMLWNFPKKRRVRSDNGK